MNEDVDVVVAGGGCCLVFLVHIFIAGFIWPFVIETLTTRFHTHVVIIGFWLGVLISFIPYSKYLMYTGLLMSVIVKILA